MARGLKKHLKRLHAPKHWQLDKTGGSFAPHPSNGPHKLRECLPLMIFIRNRLKYALNFNECTKILKQRLVKVDGKIRTDKTYPAGFMDVISIDRTSEYFRLIYNIKGHFLVHRITPEEAKYKLCRVTKIFLAPKAVPVLTTHDGRTIRYPNPSLRANDVIQLNIDTGKIMDHIKFDIGNVVMVTGGRNIGRVGTVTDRVNHIGTEDMIHIKDARGNVMATRMNNVFTIGKNDTPWVSLPTGDGIKLSKIEIRDLALAAKGDSSGSEEEGSEEEEEEDEI